MTEDDELLEEWLDQGELSKREMPEGTEMEWAEDNVSEEGKV